MSDLSTLVSLPAWTLANLIGRVERGRDNMGLRMAIFAIRGQTSALLPPGKDLWLLQQQRGEIVRLLGGAGRSRPERPHLLRGE